MITPFNGGIVVTQDFGLRPEYYKQFGLAGHEGMDCVPADGDRTVYCVEEGVVVRDVDPGERYDAYGYVVVIWNQQNKRAWWYAHNQSNMVEPNQYIKRGQKIAIMGGSGNVQGDHLHLGLRYSDSNGNAINLNNGYQGFVNPRPILKALNENDGNVANNPQTPTNNPSQPTNQIPVNITDKASNFDKIVHELYTKGYLSKDNADIYSFIDVWKIVQKEIDEHARLAPKSSNWDRVCDYLGFANADVVSFEEVKSKLVSQKDTINKSQIKDILYGKGYTYQKLNKLKDLIPK